MTAVKDPAFRVFMGVGLIGGAAALALILAFALTMPGPAAVAGPIGHDDPNPGGGGGLPPISPPLPPPCGIQPLSLSICPPPPPYNPYPCFPGQGKHLGFGNGHGRAGAVFKFGCLYAIF